MRQINLQLKAVYLLLHVIVLLTVPCFAQNTPVDNLFSNKDYQGYVANLSSVLVTTANEKSIDFSRIVKVAIALDKTNGWDADTGKQAAQLLTASPDAVRYLNAMHMLLAGKSDGLLQLNAGALPPYDAWQSSIPLLQTHGYDFAANAFRVAVLTGNSAFAYQDPRVMQGGILAWVSFSAEQRQAVDQFVDARLEENAKRQQEIAQSAFGLIMYPPATLTITAEQSTQIFALAIKLGKTSGVITQDTAMALFNARKKTEAARIMQLVAADHPTDATAQIKAANFMLRSCHDEATAVACFQSALQSVPEPSVRSVRLAYLSYLLDFKKTDTLATFATDMNAVLAADSLFAQKRYPEALEKYTATFQNTQVPLPTRCDAWGGLLVVDPAGALQNAELLLTEIEHQPAEQRTALLHWFGCEVWQAVAYANRSDSIFMGNTCQRASRRITDAQNWAASCMALMDRVLAANPESCLRPDNMENGLPIRSLRTPIAVIDVLAGHPEKSVQILRQQYEWDVPPPPGGWPNARTAAAAMQPYHGVSPGYGDYEKCALSAMVYLSRSTTPAFSACLLDDITAHLPADANALRPVTVELAATAIKNAAQAIDTPVAPGTDVAQPPVNLTAFAPVETAYRHLLTSDIMVKNTPKLLEQGVLLALLYVRDQGLQDHLFTLLTDTLDRYTAVMQNPAIFNQEVTAATITLSSRHDRDLQPYVEQLQKRYPKP